MLTCWTQNARVMVRRALRLLWRQQRTDLVLYSLPSTIVNVHCMTADESPESSGAPQQKRGVSTVALGSLGASDDG